MFDLGATWGLQKSRYPDFLEVFRYSGIPPFAILRIHLCGPFLGKHNMNKHPYNSGMNHQLLEHQAPSIACGAAPSDLGQVIYCNSKEMGGDVCPNMAQAAPVGANIDDIDRRTTWQS